MKNEDFRVGLDVEGIIVKTGYDFAWLTYDNLLSEETKATFPRKICEMYDSRYDDGRYLWELKHKRKNRYSTGKWPLVSLCLAIYDGRTEEELINYARRTIKLNPGADELVKYLKVEAQKELFLITSSYPAVPIITAEKLRIPYERIFCMGSPVPPRQIFPGSFKDVIADKSPLVYLLFDYLYKDKMFKFLSSYLFTCERLAEAYEGGNKRIIENILRFHDNLLKEDWILRKLFLLEEGCMGSHRKVKAMRSVFDNREKWIYVGDGIVDAMAIKYAKYGISMNMTNEHALRYSKLNIATPDISNLIPIFDSIFSNKFDPKRLKKELNSDETKIFTRRDIHTNLQKVVDVNKEMKNELKKLFKI